MKICLLILTRDSNPYIESIYNFNSSIEVKIISDSSIDDKILLDSGFTGLTMMVKKPSAWDKAFYLIDQNQLYNEYDFFYIMEDDVYCSNITKIFDIINILTQNKIDFISRQILTKSNSLSWYWWNKPEIQNEIPFEEPVKSFNPFCRLSSILIKQILDFRIINNKFFFHEILFASIAQKNNLSILTIENSIVNDYFGKFIYRPILEKSSITDDKIYHPVKPDYKIKFPIHQS